MSEETQATESGGEALDETAREDIKERIVEVLTLITKGDRAGLGLSHTNTHRQTRRDP